MFEAALQNQLYFCLKSTTYTFARILLQDAAMLWVAVYFCSMCIADNFCD
jgi:hypothetical protein